MAVFQQREQHKTLHIQGQASPSWADRTVQSSAKIIKRPRVPGYKTNNNITVPSVVCAVASGRGKDPNQQGRTQDLLAETPVRLHFRIAPESAVRAVQFGD